MLDHRAKKLVNNTWFHMHACSHLQLLFELRRQSAEGKNKWFGEKRWNYFLRVSCLSKRFPQKGQLEMASRQVLDRHGNVFITNTEPSAKGNQITLFPYQYMCTATVYLHPLESFKHKWPLFHYVVEKPLCLNTGRPSQVLCVKTARTHCSLVCHDSAVK